MSEINPYAPPQATLEEPAPVESLPKAGPGRRFLARAGDNILVVLVAVGIVVVATGLGYDLEDEILGNLGLALAFLIVFPVQAYLLARHGQSLMKKLLDLRIVRPDGTRADPLRIIFVREVLPTLLAMIPYAGVFFSLADALAIFGSETRCLHDRMGDTIVVDLRPSKEQSLRLGSLRA